MNSSMWCFVILVAVLNIGNVTNGKGIGGYKSKGNTPTRNVDNTRTNSNGIGFSKYQPKGNTHNTFTGGYNAPPYHPSAPVYGGGKNVHVSNTHVTNIYNNTPKKSGNGVGSAITNTHNNSNVAKGIGFSKYESKGNTLNSSTGGYGAPPYHPSAPVYGGDKNMHVSNTHVTNVYNNTPKNTGIGVGSAISNTHNNSNVTKGIGFSKYESKGNTLNSSTGGYGAPPYHPSAPVYSSEKNVHVSNTHVTNVYNNTPKNSSIGVGSAISNTHNNSNVVKGIGFSKYEPKGNTHNTFTGGYSAPPYHPSAPVNGIDKNVHISNTHVTNVYNNAPKKSGIGVGSAIAIGAAGGLVGGAIASSINNHHSHPPSVIQSPPAVTNIHETVVIVHTNSTLNDTSNLYGVSSGNNVINTGGNGVGYTVERTRITTITRGSAGIPVPSSNLIFCFVLTTFFGISMR